MSFPVVLSGAGLSADYPCLAPLGPELRDAYLRHVIESAGAYAPVGFDGLRDIGVWDKRLEKWPLEVIVGMLVAVIGEIALEPLAVVLKGEANNAHKLAARLLATPEAPKVHLTLNFDNFVERAFLDEFGRNIVSLTPDDNQSLEQLATENWVALSSPVVVHLHGRATARGGATTFSGIVATLDRIAQVPPSSLVGILRRALQGNFLVTGYSGADTDITPALLTEARRVSTNEQRVWNLKTIPALNDWPWREITKCGFSLTAGGAAAELAIRLGEAPPAPSPHKQFDPKQLASRLPLREAEGALLLAWVLQDAGGSGRHRALEILSQAPPDDVTPDLEWLWVYKLGTLQRQLRLHEQAIRSIRVAAKRASTPIERADCEVELAETYQRLLGSQRIDRKIVATLASIKHLGLARKVAQRLPEDSYSHQRIHDLIGNTYLLACMKLLVANLRLTRAPARLMSRLANQSFHRALRGKNAHLQVTAHAGIAESQLCLAFAGEPLSSFEEVDWSIEHASRISDFLRHSIVDARLSLTRSLRAVARGALREAAALLAQAERTYASDGLPADNPRFALSRMLIANLGVTPRPEGDQ